MFSAGIITAYIIQSAHTFRFHSVRLLFAGVYKQSEVGRTPWTIFCTLGTAFPCVLLHFDHWRGRCWVT